MMKIGYATSGLCSDCANITNCYIHNLTRDYFTCDLNDLEYRAEHRTLGDGEARIRAPLGEFEVSITVTIGLDECMHHNPAV